MGRRSSQRSASWLPATNRGRGHSSTTPRPRMILPDHGKHMWGRGILNRTEEDIIIMKSSKKKFKNSSLTSGWVSTNCLDLFFCLCFGHSNPLLIKISHYIFFWGHFRSLWVIELYTSFANNYPLPPTGKKSLLCRACYINSCFSCSQWDIKEGAGIGRCCVHNSLLSCL